jgi:hypothetical protein
MQPSKMMFRFLGGQIVYVGCDEEEVEKRIVARGTQHLLPFVKKIPNLGQTKEMAVEHRLSLFFVETNGSVESVRNHAERFSNWLNREENQWKMFSPGSCLAI